MKLNKLAIATAGCIALAGGGGAAHAAIPGIPGEALLVPLVMTSANDNVAPIETYVGLTVPTTIGTDQIINVYTAPNTTTFGSITTQSVVPYPAVAVGQSAFPRIYWTLYNENSVKVQDGFCQVSPGDMVVWTTDREVQKLQVRQTSEILQAGIQGVPASTCGPTARPRFGYVVFQTVQGADGLDAGFAFAGDAAVLEANLGGMFAVPVMPMADGADAGQTEPRLYNEVIAGGQYGTGQAASPIAVAPILSGIRMNDADGVKEDVVIQAPIQGPLSGSGHSMHVFWFDRNDAARSAFMNIWDDQEGICSMTYPFPRELNILVYNLKTSEGAGFDTTSDWRNLDNADFNEDQALTDLISAVQPNPLTGYKSGNYCAPTYWVERNIAGPFRWNGALAGYVEYTFDEIGEPAQPGFVNSAAVAFHLQQAPLPYGPSSKATLDSCNGGGCGSYFFPGWSSHMATDRGKH